MKNFFVLFYFSTAIAFLCAPELLFAQSKPLKTKMSGVSEGVDLKASAIKELVTAKSNTALQSASVSEKDLLVLRDPGAQFYESPWSLTASVLIQKFKPAGNFNSKNGQSYNFDPLASSTMPGIELSIARRFKIKNYSFKGLLIAQGGYSVQATEAYFKTGAVAENSRLILQSSGLGIGLILSNPWLDFVDLEIGYGQGNFNYSHKAKQDFASFSQDLEYSFNHLGLIFSVTHSWGVFLRSENKQQSTASSLIVQQQAQIFGTRFVW
jgi:hypothetical protein